MEHTIYYMCHDKDGTPLGEEEALAWDYVRDILHYQDIYEVQKGWNWYYNFLVYRPSFSFIGLGIFWLVWS